VSAEVVRADLLWEPAELGAVVALRATTCGACGRTEFPSTHGCPACGGAVTEVALGPIGELRGFTEVLHPPPGAQVEVPYTLAVAAFPDADLAVLGLLDGHRPCDELAIGMPVEVCVVATGAGATYGFRLT